MILLLPTYDFIKLLRVIDRSEILFLVIHNSVVLLIVTWNSIMLQICKGHIKAAYQISDWSNKRELRYTVGKLTENYEGKMDFEPLWPWPLTQCHQFQ